MDTTNRTDSAAQLADAARTALRDEFAGKAMQGLIAAGTFGDGEMVASMAYRLADAMLRARERS
ncbi:hypothetical protein [Burkholderia cenocepacia]|uniref:hypothetical protein n=1 Tax=Burkholderia cenocepacia TaxID=95486 RepID=UPI002238CBFB|nr:hypothetical protein [Burkholderia cenocepacia]MCW5141085.1 hypothetical protein [Burkholderia cenocepacia]